MTVFSGEGMSLSRIAISLMIFMPEDDLVNIYDFWPNYLANMSGALLGGLFGGSMLVYKLNEEYRERTFLFGILNVAFLFITIYIGISILTTVGYKLANFESDQGVSLGQDILTTIIEMFVNPSFWISMIIWSLLVSGTQFMLQVNDKFGQGILWQFLTG